VSATVVPRSEAGARAGAASSGGPWDHPRLHRQQTLALHLFAGELAGAADGFRFLPDSLLGGFFVTAAEPHLAEDALALHLFLQHPEGLVDIVVTDENLHGRSSSIERLMGPMAKRPGHWRTDMHNSGANGTRGTNQRRHSKLCLPMGTMAANWNGDFGTSPFFGQLFG
jgi:hypothetical protein